MATFYYDADCGFCTWALAHLRRLTRELHTEPGKGLYIQRNAYYRDDEGRIHLGHRAISRALRTHGRANWVRCAGVLAGLPPAALVYRLIAWNRHRLGPLVGAETCQI